MQPLRETYACGVPTLNEANERWHHLRLLTGFRPPLLLNHKDEELSCHYTQELHLGPPERLEA